MLADMMVFGAFVKCAPPQFGQASGTNVWQSVQSRQSQGRTEAYLGSRRTFLPAAFSGFILDVLLMPPRSF